MDPVPAQLPARLSRRIQRVIVSTDCQEIADISRRYGAEAPFMRPPEFATDNSPDREFVVHALDWFEAHEEHVPDYLVHLRPTTPLRRPEIIDAAIDMFLEHGDATSLRSGHPAPESPFKWFWRDDERMFRNLADAPGIAGYSNLPRQQMPTVYIPNGYVDVLKTEHVRCHDDIHGPSILAFETPMGYEVDVAEDFDYLSFLVQRNGSPLLQYLAATSPLTGS